MKKLPMSFVFASLLALGLAAGAAAATPQKPNIIFILGDDVGMGDIACTGSDRFKTPHIDALARGGTLAVYMGVVTLPLLRDGLLAAGLDPATPAALIERGGTLAQRTLHGTLDALVAEGPGWSTGGPTLVLLGAAVGRAVRHAPVEAACDAEAEAALSLDRGCDPSQVKGMTLLKS